MKNTKFIFLLLSVFGALNSVVAQTQSEIKETDYKIYCPIWDDSFWQYVCIAQNARNNLDWKNSHLYYKKLVEFGFTEAYFELAQQYYYGNGVKKNLELAFSNAVIAAKNGHYRGQHFLSKLYMEGAAVERSVASAYKWSYITTIGIPEDAITNAYLNKLAENLDNSQILNAKNSANICKLTNYKTCD